jgi:hypothetical protein
MGLIKRIVREAKDLCAWYFQYPKIRQSLLRGNKVSPLIGKSIIRVSVTDVKDYSEQLHRTIDLLDNFERLQIFDEKFNHLIFETCLAMIASGHDSNSLSEYFSFLSRINERIQSSDKPMALVSIQTHKNILLNEKMLEMKECDPITAREQDLRALWIPPGQINSGMIGKPIEGIPPHLEEVIKQLKQQSVIERCIQNAWRTDYEFVQFTLKAEYFDFGIEQFRLMTFLEYKPVT